MQHSTLNQPCDLRVSEAREESGFATGWIALGAVAAIAAVIVGSGAPAVCKAQPIALRFEENVFATMTVAKGTRCSMRVDTGAALIDGLVIDPPARSGIVLARGRTGVIYQPARHFTGEDSFSFSLQGRTEQGPGTMTVRVGVLVE